MVSPMSVPAYGQDQFVARAFEMAPTTTSSSPAHRPSLLHASVQPFAGGRRRSSRVWHGLGAGKVDTRRRPTRECFARDGRHLSRWTPGNYTP